MLKISRFLFVLILTVGGCLALQAEDPLFPGLPQWAGNLPGSGPGFDTYLGIHHNELGYYFYPSASGRARIALVYLHGMVDHSGWFHYAARMLSASGYDVYSLDRRGSGINRENRGYVSGHVNHYFDLQRDIHEFIRKDLRGKYDAVFLVGYAWGGKQAALYAMEYPDSVNGIILITPTGASGVDASLLDKFGIYFSRVFWQKKSIEPPVQTDAFTGVPAFRKYLRDDPLELHEISARFFVESSRMDVHLQNRIQRLNLPVFLILGSDDPVIDNDAVVELFRQSKGFLQIKYFPGQRHLIQLEEPAYLVENIRMWLRAQITSP